MKTGALDAEVSRKPERGELWSRGRRSIAGGEDLREAGEVNVGSSSQKEKKTVVRLWRSGNSPGTRCRGRFGRRGSGGVGIDDNVQRPELGNGDRGDEHSSFRSNFLHVGVEEDKAQLPVVAACRGEDADGGSMACCRGGIGRSWGRRGRREKRRRVPGEEA
jgi:hypothetical protein